MTRKGIARLLILLCLLSTSCTVGIVQRGEGGPVATATSITGIADTSAQATIDALSTQNAALATQVATHASPTPGVTSTQTSVPVVASSPYPTRTPAPTSTPTPCPMGVGDAFQPRLGSHAEILAGLGCPITEQQSLWSAEQVFQHGRMLWREDRNEAYILYDDTSTYQVEDDPFVEGDPADDCPEVGDAPEGLYKPVRGFNRQWCNVPGVRDRLGWALENEVGYGTMWQTFAHGMVVLNRGDHIFVLYDDGTWDFVD